MTTTPLGSPTSFVRFTDRLPYVHVDEVDEGSYPDDAITSSALSGLLSRQPVEPIALVYSMHTNDEMFGARTDTDMIHCGHRYHRRCRLPTPVISNNTPDSIAFLAYVHCGVAGRSQTSRWMEVATNDIRPGPSMDARHQRATGWSSG